MKVILTQDIKGTGRKDQIISVSDGFARNYLLPKKLAVEATDKNVTGLRRQVQAQEIRQQSEREKAVQSAEKMGELTLRIRAKVGKETRLFGSITSREIADALKAQHGIEVDKKKIELREPIRHLGEAIVDVRLYTGVSAQLKILVEAEDA